MLCVGTDPATLRVAFLMFERLDAERQKGKTSGALRRRMFFLSDCCG
jgi:hypothetical protein